MADELTPQPSLEAPAAGTEAPVAPAVDPQEVEYLRNFHNQYKPVVDAVIPYQDHVVRYATDEGYRNYISTAERASEAIKQEQDDTPAWAKKIVENQTKVDKFIETQTEREKQNAQMMESQNRLAEIAKKYPGLAQDNYKAVMDFGQELLKNKVNLDTNQFISLVETMAPRLAPQVKEPPTSTRVDAGIPSIVSAPARQKFDNNRERGNEILNRLRKATG